MSGPSLLPLGYVWRSGGVLCLLSVLTVLYFWNPEGSNIKISTNLLQEFVGIPCPLCGVTRGTHLVLQGEWSRAFYFSMMSFMVVAVGVALCLLWLLEMIRGRDIYTVNRMLLLLLGKWKYLLGGLALYWMVHLYLVWSLQKWELLNPDAYFFPSHIFSYD